MINKDSNGSTFAAALQMTGSRARVPVLQLTRNSGIAAAISKAVNPTTTPRHTADGTRMIDVPPAHTLQHTSNQIANNISQADTTLQMIPDTELGAQILISAVLSPKDMMTLELIYTATPGLVPAAVSAQLVAIIRKNFDDVYKIKSKLPRILREVLIERGAHVVAVIPENSIDEMINRNNAISLESYNQVMTKENDYYGTASKYGLAASVGLLGPGLEEESNAPQANRPGATTGVHALENYGFGSFGLQQKAPNQVVSINIAAPNSPKNFAVMDHLIVTDNPNILRGPSIEQKLQRDQMVRRLRSNRIQVAVESHAANKGIKLDDRSLKAAIYKSRKRGVETMQVMKTESQLSRTSIGRPLLMELPPESVIPIYVPGQEDKHVGYFILLDRSGYPVRSSKEHDALGSMTRRLNAATNQQQNVFNRLQQLTEGFGCTSDQERDEAMSRIYADMVEADLLARLRNGVYNNNVALAKNPEYYRVMLTRVLSQQQTTILFMPMDMVTYFARKYNKWGVGVSILDDMKVLNNQRALVALANTMLALRNSIPRTNVELTVDEDSPDPYKVAEMFMGEMMRVNQTSIPLGASSPVDMLDYFQRAAWRVNIKGHPGIPEMSAEITEGQSSYQRVDTDYEKNLQERAMMTMGLNSEIVNNGFNQETATSVVANNLMLSRRVAVLQEQINPHVTDYHKKIIRADEEILLELRESLRGSYNELNIDEEEIRKELGLDQAVELRDVVIDHIISEFVETMEVTLPPPETASMANQLSALQGFTELLAPAVDAYVSSEFFTDETAGELNRSVDSVKKILMAHFIRKFMVENGIMPELGAILAGEDNEEGFDLWETQSNHIKSLTRSFGQFMRRIHETKKKENQSVERMNNDMEDNAGGGVSSSSTADSTSTSSVPDPLDPMDGIGDDLVFDDPSTKVPDGAEPDAAPATEPGAADGTEAGGSPPEEPMV